MKPIEQLQSAAPAASEWDLEGWETNAPPASPLAEQSAQEENDAAQLASEAAIDNAETVSLVADVDPEAAILDALVESETGIKQSASEEASNESTDHSPTEETSDDILSDIVAAERECERAEAIVIGLTARLKEAKEEFKGAQITLRRLVREVGNDSERPMVARQVAAKVPTVNEVDPNEDEDDADEDDSDYTDLEDSARGEGEGRSESQGDQMPTELGKPTRIRITKEDPNYPQLIVGNEHDVTAFEDEIEDIDDVAGVVAIDDPANPNGELFLGIGEYEVIAWEEVAVAVAGKIESNASPEATGPNSAAASQAKANAKNSRPEDDSWRKASLLNDVGLPPNLAALLEGNPEKTIKTMGDVHDWTEKGKFLSDIPKIGPAKVTQLEDAFERYWAKWNAKK